MVLKVLFVADDPNLQRTIRQGFESSRREWDVSVSRGGPEALARLDGPALDALVTDARLAGSDCTELLTEVRRRQPAAARIALANQGDQAHNVRLVSLAHRVLPKPCDPAEIRGAIQRVRCLRELLGSPSLTAVVSRLTSVPALSTLYAQIADELSFPDFSLAAVGDLVSRDLAIAARLLQMANSALVGLRKPASSPGQAVRVLGADLTRTLVLAADLFSRYNPHALKPFSIEVLWEYSQAVADLAGRIAAAERAGDRLVREAALSGLFHDIGRLVLASQLPGPYREVLQVVRVEGLGVAEAERRILGTSHAEVGAYLLGLWGLPDPIVEAVAWHHDPGRCPGTAFTALTAVHAADAILQAPHGVTPDREYLARLGLTDRFEAWSQLRGEREKSA